MISFILPTRNTINYTKKAYSSLRKYNPDEEIIILDDLSNDGTLEWLDTLTNDKNLIIYKNDPINFPKTYNYQKFSGHTILYNRGVEMAKNEIVGVFHSDMVATKNFTKNLLKHLNKPKTIVSSTRIEPPIYPGDQAKILKDFGFYAEDFKEKEFELFVENQEKEMEDFVSNGFFAPWAMYREEYLKIKMCEDYAPWPIEDSQFAVELYLNNYDMLQSRDSFCYHFGSKSHKEWATKGIGYVSEEFKFLEQRNIKIFFDKWGFYPAMDEWSYPIIPIDKKPL